MDATPREQARGEVASTSRFSSTHSAAIGRRRQHSRSMRAVTDQHAETRRRGAPSSRGGAEHSGVLSAAEAKDLPTSQEKRASSDVLRRTSGAGGGKGKWQGGFSGS